ncbi:MAG: hypothetical protein P4L98_19715 [Ancalomicrobiaceae bacterium]|nr:hypothetical protein [Ancalomicrobiaceae bacterium]
MAAYSFEFWRLALARSVAAAGVMALVACSGGIAETGGVPVAAAPQADLDTAKPPPRTVTETPLLPPVQTTPNPLFEADSRYVPPPVEHLYSEDEQAKIEAELAAAAKGQNR